MSRFQTNIKKVDASTSSIDLSIAILAAGNGNKIKSYEPRSLLKINGVTILDGQLQTIANIFKDVEVISVVGCHANKIIKKFKTKTRIVENQLFDETNSAESLRLAFNNSGRSNFMFVHGDVVFNTNALNVSYTNSFLIIDSKQNIKDHEIGVTMLDGKASILSYGVPIKWGQIAFFTGKEYKILGSILHKFSPQDKKKLSFELINQIIEMGGEFNCYEPSNMKLLEIDRIKDIE
jgi:choline kinase